MIKLIKLWFAIFFCVLLPLPWLMDCTAESIGQPPEDSSYDYPYDYPIETMLSIQNGDGGFGGVPVFDPIVTLSDTYYGLYSLELLNIPVSQEHVAKLQTLVSSLTLEDILPIENSWTLDRLYFYIKLTKALNLEPNPELIQQGISLVAGLQHEDGFFYPSPGEKDSWQESIFEHPVNAAPFIVMAIEMMRDFGHEDKAAAALAWQENCVAAELSREEADQSEMQDRIGIAKAYLASCRILEHTPPPEIMNLISDVWQKQMEILSAWPENGVKETNLFHLHNLFYCASYLEDKTAVSEENIDLASAIDIICGKLEAFYRDGLYTVFPLTEAESLDPKGFLGGVAPIIATASALEIQAYQGGAAEENRAAIEKRVIDSVSYDGSFRFGSYYTSDIVETYFACSILEGSETPAPEELRQALSGYLRDDSELEESSYPGLMYLQLCQWNDMAPADTAVRDFLQACMDKYKQDGLPPLDLTELLLFAKVSKEYGFKIDFNLKSMIRRQYANSNLPAEEDIPLYMQLSHRWEKYLLFHEMGLPIPAGELREAVAAYREQYFELEEPLYGSYWALTAMARLGQTAAIRELPESIRADLRQHLTECWDGYFYSITPSYQPNLEATSYYLTLDGLLN